MKMFFKTWLLFSILCITSLYAAQKCQPNKKVVCYYGTWAAYRTGNGTYTMDDVDPFLCTHLIYSFFGVNAEGDALLLDSWLDLPDGGGHGYIQKMNALKQINPKLKTIAAFGGWNQGSTNFAIVANSAELRAKFAQNLFDFCQKYGFDGVDIDWEYPTLRNDLNYDDRNNFSLLLEAIYKLFNPVGYLITAAVSATKSRAETIYDVPTIAKYLDIINIMAYDLHIGTEELTGFNAALYPPAEFVNEEEEELNGESILDYWTSVAPSQKLAFGVPFYGHSFTLANVNENGPYSPSSGPGPAGPYTQEAGTISYNELCIQWQTQNWTQIFDQTQGVPYAYLNETWVSYDDPQSIALKAQQAFKYNLGGIMLWSLESDDFNGNCGQGKNPLLNTINNVLFNKQK